MTGHEIRQKFLDFFAERGHRMVASSSLVPHNDPTLLFTNAGMNQFKDVFTGAEQRDYSRATTSQKCVRAGGKHNDLENVGYTRRHHTFFEMLGNFSFGDYFKADAIAFAWNLITKVYGLPQERLYITVFREDDEAEELWQKVAGVPRERIFRLDEKDNFWQMGDTGPCGPCSEIHYDYGADAAAPGREHEQFPDDGGGRFVEIWNLVFMQFDRDASGKLTPLPRPSIDTGMGLERIAAILQGKLSNYECDLLSPLVAKAGALLGKQQGEEQYADTVMRIIADHSRASAFLIHDGVVPSNEGRGYVLRKIMRRAIRNARRVGLEEPFLAKMTAAVAEHMRPAYPELMDSIQRVARVVNDEEARYASTFQVAERVFRDEAKSAQNGVLAGPVAFKLYDTFGLALDEQDDMAREYGLTLDRDGFEAEMQGQRERARASWKGAEKKEASPVYQELQAQHGRTKFAGYDSMSATGSKILALLKSRELVPSLGAGEEGELVLDQTPFYAEAGGQVGDQGRLLASGGQQTAAEIKGVYAAVPGLSVHKVTAMRPIQVGETVDCEVEVSARRSTMRNHTATHLLHAALRTVLGTHVKQAGSVVEPGRLRFDFTHYTAVTPDELAEVERMVNEQILGNKQVSTDVMDIDQALQTGAMALFGEKYGSNVRVVSIPGFSKELCGGTHVSRTGDIGLLKVTSEGSISAGVRRIEAVTGEVALRRFQDATQSLARVSQVLRTNEDELLDQAEKLIAAQRTLERQLQQLKERVAQSQLANIEQEGREMKGVRVISKRLEGLDRAQLRTLADSIRNKVPSVVIVLATSEDDQVSLLAAVSKDLTGRVHAGKLVGSLAQAVGGKGGGRPDLAEAGGKDASALPQALEGVYAMVERLL